MVYPWLTVPISGHSATNISSSLCRMAVKICLFISISPGLNLQSTSSEGWKVRAWKETEANAVTFVILQFHSGHGFWTRMAMWFVGIFLGRWFAGFSWFFWGKDTNLLGRRSTWFTWFFFGGKAQTFLDADLHDLHDFRFGTLIYMIYMIFIGWVTLIYMI